MRTIGNLTTVFAIAIVGVLLAGTLAAAGAARASPTPEGTVVAAADLGVVTIWANGTVSNPAAPISVNGNVYRLTGPLNGSVVILRDNAVFNGSGYAVNYTNAGGSGNNASISVLAANSVTVEDVRTVNDTVGIRANATANLTIIADEPTGSAVAINVSNATHLLVSQNQFAAGGNATELTWVNGATVTSNALNGSVNGIVVTHGQNLTITSNWVLNSTHEPIYLVNVTNVVGESNQVQGSGVGFEVDYGTNLLLAHNNVSDSTTGDGYGIGVYFGTNFTVSNNTVINDTYPLWAQNSNQGSFADNNASAATDDAVWMEYVGQTTVSGNVLTDAAQYALYGDYDSAITVRNNQGNGSVDGFEFEYSQAVSMIDNNASFSTDGFGLYYTQDSSMVHNVAFGSEYPLWAEYSGGALAANNSARNSTYGFYDYENSGVVVTGNDFTGSEYGLYSEYTANLTFSSNLASFSSEGAYVYEDLGSVVVSANQFVNDSTGLYFEDVYGSVLVVGNNISNSAAGITSYYTYGAFTVQGNDLAHNGYAIYLYEDYGGDSVIGNSIQHASEVGIASYYAEAPSTIDGNNVTGSNTSLYLYEAYYYYNTQVAGNDFSNSNRTLIYDSYLLSGFFDNNLLNDRNISLLSNDFGYFYHNNLNSSAFNATGSYTSSGFFNDPYPIGGNYWTGYTGVDRYSGVSQNLPGSDGIGDTSYTVGAATDDYPLMHPWRTSTVSFQEAGLPVGGTWSVSLNGQAESGASGGTIAFVQANGAYTPFTYTVVAPAGYTATPVNGSGIENGTNQVITITFAPVLYNLTVSVSGLPSGTHWTLTVNSVVGSSTASSVVLAEPNGTYAYTVRAAGYTASPSSGSVTIAGSSMSVSVTFRAVTYSVEFVESGLKSSAPWSVTLNGTTATSSTTNLSFAAENGTFSFSVSVPKGYHATPSSGRVSVQGNAVSVYLVAASNSTGTGGSSSLGGTLTSTDYGLVAGLVLALVAALIGWLLYLRGRRGGNAAGSLTPYTPPPPSGEPGSPPAGAAGEPPKTP